MGELICDHKLTLLILQIILYAAVKFCAYKDLDYSVGPDVILCDFCAKIDFFA